MVIYMREVTEIIGTKWKSGLMTTERASHLLQKLDEWFGMLKEGE